MIVRVLSSGLLLFAMSAVASDASDLIERMSARYSELLPAVRMTAEVRKRQSSGEFWKQGTRTYRVFLSGGDLRVDLLSDVKGASIVRVRQGGRLVLFNSMTATYSDQANLAAGTEDTADVLQQYRITFFDRFLHLAQASPKIAATKRVKLKAGGEERDCLRIDIRSPEGSEIKWSGKVWIETGTAFVWRAQMAARDKLQQLVDEDIVWDEIAAGPAAIAEGLPWSPPANALRIPRWTHTLPR